MISYKLIRSKHKTLALYIRNSVVEIRAPLKAPERDINNFVVSKEKWIADKLALTSERQKQREAFTVNYGDTAQYCGKKYPIVAKPGKRLGFADERFYMPPDLNSAQIKFACVQIYRTLAKRDLNNRVLDLAK